MKLRERPWVAVLPLGLAAGGIAAAIVLTSDHQKMTAAEGVLGLLLGWSFIGTGLYAWERRPRNRTGRLMVAVGFTSFLGALTAANSSLPYTLGVAVGALALAVFVHLLFAFPNGRLESRSARVLVAVGYPLALLANLTSLLVDSTPTDNCPKCPSNAFLVADSHTAANALTVFWNCAGGVFMIAAAVLLARRWRASTAPARRVLAPVYVGGLASVLLLAVGFSLSQLTGAGDAVVTVGLIGFISVPFLFLAGLLRARLARTAATQLLQQTSESPPLEEAQASLRRLLKDPTLRLLVREDAGGYVDADGRNVRIPEESATAAVTRLGYDGQPIAAVVHDPALRDEPELLDDVLAAARVALVKDRSVQALRASERRNRALLSALPDNMFRIRADGVYLDFYSNTPERLTVPPDRIVGSRIEEHMPAEHARLRMEAIRRVIATGKPETFEVAITDRQGRVSDREVRIVKSGEDEVTLIMRDVTDRKRAEQEVLRQQEELRRSRARIVEAETAERRRLERNLHDGAQQRLVTLSLALRLVQSKLEKDPRGAADMLAGAAAELTLALEELRELARGIHPAILSDRGLAVALEGLAARAPVPVELDCVPDERLPGPVEAAAFYLVSEALTNVAKYSQASYARVSVACEDDFVHIAVVDDGIGGADESRGTGLSGLADRVGALDGTLVVDSPPGRGTVVRASIPLPVEVRLPAPQVTG